LAAGERLLANVYIPGPIAKLEPAHLFPILEPAFPEPPHEKPSPAEEFIPRAMAKLRSGEPLRILAWGDSVTAGTYLPGGESDRWQGQFVTRLCARFPRAKIELLTEAWPGRNTDTYRAEPPGSMHNFAEKVLALKPGLIVSEFINDAGMSEQAVKQRYGKLLRDFKRIDAEWIILSPHYMRPDMMGLTKERKFTTLHPVALADASLRYGRLWRQGIPYSTLMLNAINHPDARGMKLFADSLMALFPDNDSSQPVPQQ
jgi:hypothetical protein